MFSGKVVEHHRQRQPAGLHRARAEWYIGKSTDDTVDLNEIVDIPPKLATNFTKHGIQGFV